MIRRCGLEWDCGNLPGSLISHSVDHTFVSAHTFRYCLSPSDTKPTGAGRSRRQVDSHLVMIGLVRFISASAFFHSCEAERSIRKLRNGSAQSRREGVFKEARRPPRG